MTKLSFLILSLALTTVQSFAKDYGRFKTEPITLIKNGVEIHGVRIINPNGQPNFNGDPYILPHGLSSNWHEFEELIPELMSHGGDVYAFNWRFHGNGDERSVDLNFREGDSIFNDMARTDFPMMIDYIQRIRPGRKIKVIGHSMGGMVPRAALILGTVSSKVIDKMVLIGSPAKFSGRRASALEELGLKPLLRAHLYSGQELDPVFVKSDLHLAEAAADTVNLLNPLYWIAKEALKRHLHNRARAEMGPVVDEEEFQNRKDAMITDRLPKKILREFDEFSRRYDYENVPIDDVKILHIAGGKDKLAPWKDIYEGAQIQSAKPGFWFILVKGIGHFGIVSKWTISRYIGDVFKFFDDPNSLGPKNKTFIQIEPNRGGFSAFQCQEIF